MPFAVTYLCALLIARGRVVQRVVHPVALWSAQSALPVPQDPYAPAPW